MGMLCSLASVRKRDRGGTTGCSAMGVAPLYEVQRWFMRSRHLVALSLVFALPVFAKDYFTTSVGPAPVSLNGFRVYRYDPDVPMDKRYSLIEKIVPSSPGAAVIHLTAADPG